MRQRWRDCCSLSLVTDNLIQIILALTYKGLGLEGDPVAVVPGGLSSFTLLNPRLGFQVTYNFDSFLSVISSGRTKVDILQLFMSLVGSRLVR